jgi:hypothetical protein
MLCRDATFNSEVGDGVPVLLLAMSNADKMIYLQR